LVVCALFMSINSFAQDAQQALIEAVQAKNLDAVKKVVEELKADVNVPSDNKAIGKPYALHVACKTLGPSVEIVKYLIEKGATVNVEDNFGSSPFIALVMSHDTTNRLTIAQLLIEKGADINNISKGGGSVLGYACEYNLIDVVKLLISKGAEIDARKNNFANTPLMYAANSGNEAIVDLLLAAGADPKAERKVATKAGTFRYKKQHQFIAKEKGFLLV
jgi:ankyrin repeat protein